MIKLFETDKELQEKIVRLEKENTLLKEEINTYSEMLRKSELKNQYFKENHFPLIDWSKVSDLELAYGLLNCPNSWNNLMQRIIDEIHKRIKEKSEVNKDNE